MNFSKLVAAGNDFILVDNRSSVLKNARKEAVRLCDRKHGIGADGLILLEKSPKADVSMRIFNPDGSEAEMCGNGVRCLALFAYTKKIGGSKISIQTLAGLIHAEIKKDIVKARLANPKDLRLSFELSGNGTSREISFINTGVPHVVEFLKSVKSVDTEKEGRAIRNHDFFKPRGANVNFVALRSANAIDARTYERGVEAETLACGTGSTASALVAAALKNLKSPVSVHTQGGEILKVYFSRKNLDFFDVYLEGKVSYVFDGSL